MAITYLEEEPSQQAPAGISYLEPNAQVDQPQIKKGRDLRDEVMHQLGRFGRMAATGPTALGGAIADFGYGATGVASNLMGKPNPLGNERPSDAYQRALTEKVGLPKDEGPLENITQIIGQMAAGGLDPTTAAFQQALSKGVPAGFKAGQPSAEALTAKELHDANLTLPPDALHGGKISRGTQGFVGDAPLARANQFKNQPEVQKLAAKEVGLSPEHMGIDSLKTAEQAWIKQGYDPIKNLPPIRTGKLYRDALDDIAQKYHPKSFPTTTTPQLVEDLNTLRVGGFVPKEALTKISQLRDKASTQFGPGGDPTYGKALREMATALEDQIDRTVSRLSPTMVENFRKSRVELAKNYAVREMLVDRSTGIVDTTKAHAMLERGEKLTGGLLTIAKAGSPKYARHTAPPLHGEGVPTGWGYGPGVASIAAAPYTGGGSLAIPPALGVGRSIGKNALQSKQVQDALIENMMKQSGGQPSMFGAAAGRVAAGSMPPLADISEGLFPTFSQ